LLRNPSKGGETSVKFGYAFVWVEDVERTLQFYEEAFGLKRRFLTDNGELGLYAEMETG
jgi:predicted enzyme related to lactoylglutathione lyase